MLSSNLHVLIVGCGRRPVWFAYSSAMIGYNWYDRWSRRGALPRLFEWWAAADGMPPELMLNSTHVKAHRSVAGV